MIETRIEKIVKRDGTIVPFNSDKIRDAIWGAAKSVGGRDKARTQVLTELAVGEIEKKYSETIPDVEDVQDIVEHVLIEEGHAKVAKSFILYRQQHKERRDVKGLFDTITAIEDYLGEDWRVKENSNMKFSLQGLNNHLATTLTAKYWLGRIYPEEVRKAHENADIHMHDLGTLGAYCVGWDLEDLLTRGFKGAEGKVAAKPAKHLRVALGQVVNFFYTLQGETAGAQAFSNFDTYLAPFIRKDRLSYPEVKQAMQGFLFNLNVPTRVGFQTPFTNITMDLRVPDYMKDKMIVVGMNQDDIKQAVSKKRKEIKEKYGKFVSGFIAPIASRLEKRRLERLLETPYGGFQKEINMLNRAFAECMMEGDADGRVFTFPIPTYSITKEFNWNDRGLRPIWEMTAKYGVPYFSNFVNSDMKPEDARSMCCRLRLDNGQLRKRGGGLFGANPQTGSIGVVTVNLPRIGFISDTEQGFLGRLEELMDLSRKSLEIKRKTLERFTDIGLYPYSRFYLENVKKRFGEYWKNHFSTIGIVGMNEAIENLMPGENIATDKGKGFAIRVLDFMRGKLEEYQGETGDLFNLEATPGEGATYRLAKTDKKRFKEIKVANPGEEHPFYTNSTHLPVDYTDDLFGALELQDPLQIKYTGGTVFHAFLGERITADGAKGLVRKMTNKFHMPYITLTPTFSTCPNHGYLAGNHEQCPECDSKCEVWSRVVGYFTSTDNWNYGKGAEWRHRVPFRV